MMPDNRHLAAILFSDIVGYSRASHEDEARALRLLKAHREIMRPLLAKFEGHEIKTMGDGFLVEFTNVQGAVLCAIEMQKAHLARNAQASPAEQISVRIGIHVSDVIPSEGDVYGDGVNIAARLMQFCKPGRVCVSSGVMEQARQVIPHWVSTLGPVSFKGISHSVQSYSICVEYAADRPPPFHKRAQKMLWKQRRIAFAAALLLLAAASFTLLAPKSPLPRAAPSAPRRVAVLPLENLGLSPDLAYLPEGITDELISSLGGLKSIRVLSKSTAAVVRDKTSRQIREQLGAAYVVEGSVQKMQNQLRIRVRLIDTATEETVWSKEFEETFAQTFSLEKRIATQLAGQFSERKLASIAVDTPGASPQPDGVAYQHFLKGKYLLEMRTRDGIFKGQEQLKQAAKLDPHYAPTLAAIAHSYLLVNFYGYADPREMNRQGENYARRALAIDPTNSDALLWFAEQAAYEIRDWSRADSFYQQAISAKPDSATAFQWYGKFLTYMGRFKEAKDAFGRSLELDPLSQTAITAAGSHDFYQGNFGETLQKADEAIGIDPGALLPHLWKGEALLMMGENERALAEFQFVKDRSPGSNYLYGFETMALVRSGRTPEAEAQRKKIIAEAQNSYVGHYDLARVYGALGKQTEALSELELSAKAHESQATSLKVDPFFRDLRGNSRFEALLRNLKLVI